jgi:hypothetical protein
MEIFRLPERQVIIRFRHLVLMHDGQSILTVLSESIFCCPKHACFSSIFTPVPYFSKIKELKYVAARFRQWKIFFENIVVIYGTSIPVFLIIRFKITTTNDCSIINICKLSFISWRFLPERLPISIPLRHLLSAYSSHRRSCYRQMTAANVTPGNATSHHTVALFGWTTSDVSCASVKLSYLTEEYSCGAQHASAFVCVLEGLNSK